MHPRRLGPLVACLLAVAGCSGGRAQLHRALATIPPSSGADLAAGYAVHYPDVIEVTDAGRPDRSGRFAVGPDGGIDWPDRPHVAGLTATRVAAALAHELRVRESQVSVRVAEYRSQHLYLVGEIAAERQVVAYRGPETVVELLQRVGLTENAALGEVEVVRGHVADGKPPEVFVVDLHAILIERDPESNVRLEPSDHVHVGQRRPSKVAECLHPLIRPAYEALFGVSDRPKRSWGTSPAPTP